MDCPLEPYEQSCRLFQWVPEGLLRLTQELRNQGVETKSPKDLETRGARSKGVGPKGADPRSAETNKCGSLHINWPLNNLIKDYNKKELI